MSYETKQNTRSLFKNDKRETEKHPSHTGTLNVEGREYWLSAWVNEAKSGKKYFSIKLKAKDDAPVEPQAQADDDFGDEIPF
jgi:uncharacterized protein (DUF736 family)